MKPTVLVIISSDPRTSPRPAEAIRIAAGVGAWQKADVTVCLCEAAVLALSERVEGLVDEDKFTDYLPLLGQSGRPVYVETGVPLLKDLGNSPVNYERVSVAQLAQIAARSNYVMRF